MPIRKIALTKLPQNSIQRIGNIIAATLISWFIQAAATPGQSISTPTAESQKPKVSYDSCLQERVITRREGSSERSVSAVQFLLNNLDPEGYSLIKKAVPATSITMIPLSDEWTIVRREKELPAAKEGLDEFETLIAGLDQSREIAGLHAEPDPLILMDMYRNTNESSSSNPVATAPALQQQGGPALPNILNWTFKVLDITSQQNCEGIRVAVIDTGIKSSCIDSILADGKDFAGDQPDSDPSPASQSEWHGNLIAEVIGGTSNSNTLPGICSNATIIPIRVFKSVDKLYCTLGSKVAKGIYWAIEKKARIINASFYSSTTCDALNQAFHDASDKGILVVAAAAQDNKDITCDTPDSTYYPACLNLDNAVVVTATTWNNSGDSQDHFWPGSNYSTNSKIHVGAPTRISSGLECSVEPSFGDFSGTSVATALTTGAAAAALKKNGGTAQDLKARIIASVDHLPSLMGNVCSGGRINIKKMLEMTSEQVSQSKSSCP